MPSFSSTFSLTWEIWIRRVSRGVGAPPYLGGAEMVQRARSLSYLEVLVDVKLDLLAGECSYPVRCKDRKSAVSHCGDLIASSMDV